MEFTEVIKSTRLLFYPSLKLSSVNLHRYNYAIISVNSTISNSWHCHKTALHQCPRTCGASSVVFGSVRQSSDPWWEQDDVSIIEAGFELRHHEY